MDFAWLLLVLGFFGGCELLLNLFADLKVEK